MKNNLLILTIVFSFIFISCKSSFNSIVKEEKIEKLTEKNYKKINGNYSNHPEKFIGGLKKTPYNYHPDNTALDLYGWTFDTKKDEHIQENKKGIPFQRIQRKRNNLCLCTKEKQ